MTSSAAEGVYVACPPTAPTTPTCHSFPSVSPDTRLEIHVEHCTNCESHSTTTKHIPGQCVAPFPHCIFVTSRGRYDKAFASLSTAIQEAIGDTFPVEVISNPSHRPRVGAFEVDLIFATKVLLCAAADAQPPAPLIHRQGGARTTVVLFSKLQLKRFPNHVALSTFLMQQLALVRQVNVDLICIRCDKPATCDF